MQDAVAAREWFAQALLVAVDIGDMSSVARCLESFASLALEEANPVLAATLYGSAEALRQSIAVPATATASVVVGVVVMVVVQNEKFKLNLGSTYGKNFQFQGVPPP